MTAGVLAKATTEGEAVPEGPWELPEGWVWAALGRARGVLTEAQEKTLVGELIATPALTAQALKDEARIEKVARDVARALSAL